MDASCFCYCGINITSTSNNVIQEYPVTLEYFAVFGTNTAPTYQKVYKLDLDS